MVAAEAGSARQTAAKASVCISRCISRCINRCLLHRAPARPPVMKPRQTNSTGKTLHFFMMQALASGTAWQHPWLACGAGWGGRMGWRAADANRPSPARVPVAPPPPNNTRLPVRTRQQRVLHNVLGLRHPPGRGLVEHLALEGHRSQQAVKGALAVGGHDDQLVAQVVSVAHLALHSGLVWNRVGIQARGAQCQAGRQACRQAPSQPPAGMEVVRARRLLAGAAPPPATSYLPCTSCPCPGRCL